MASDTPYTPTPAESAEAAAAVQSAPAHPYHSTSDFIVRESDEKRPSAEAVKDTVDTQKEAAKVQDAAVKAVVDAPTKSKKAARQKADSEPSPSQAEQEKLAGNPPKVTPRVAPKESKS